MKAQFQKFREDDKAKKEAKAPFYMVPGSVLRQKLEEKKKKQRDARKKSPLSDYDRTLQKIITEKRRAAKGVPQLGEQSKQSVPPLVVLNEFGSNMSVLEDYSGPKVNLGELEDFLKGANLTADQFYGNALLANATVVDEWKRTYVRGRSLYNPWALKDLGTQMRSLNSWYMGHE